MAEIPKGKRDWPDGDERVCDGALVILGAGVRGGHVLSVNEFPKDVYTMMKSHGEDDMLVLHHHADPEVEVYARNGDIVGVNACWARIEEK